MADKFYSADGITISIANILIEGGHGDGEFLTVNQDTDDFTDVVGSTGEVAVSRTNDRRAEITLKLLQTADVNDQLSALSNLARTRGAGMIGAGPLYIRDRNGRTLFEAPTCWIAKPPDYSADRGAKMREWKIRCGQLTRFDGGNDAI